MMKKSTGIQKKASPSKNQSKISSFFTSKPNKTQNVKTEVDDDCEFLWSTSPKNNKRKLKESPESGESSTRKLPKYEMKSGQDKNSSPEEGKKENIDTINRTLSRSSTGDKQFNHLNDPDVVIEKNSGDNDSNYVSGAMSSQWDDLLNEDEDFFSDDFCSKKELSLNDFQRCIVTDIVLDRKKKILGVRDEKDEAIARIHCSGYWKDAQVEQNELIVIKAEKENENWIVDNNKGFLVVKPDTLISGTTVVGSLFCARKAVFTEKFRKMEGLPIYECDEGIATIGKLVHELLQDALCKKIKSPNDITKIVDEIMNSKYTAMSLYASGLTTKSCREQMMNFVPKIFDFLQHYVKGDNRQSIDSVKSNFKGQISKIQDIEENIWLPNLGLKGKIDVTTEVTIHSKKRIMPLEVKTGKPSFSSEHKGQIILYIMMMAMTGRDVDTGLLLYIRENSMQEVTSRYPEKRDLILLRNTMATYFSPRAFDKTLEIERTSDLPIMNLPEPINHDIFCGKCLYNSLCCTFMAKDSEKIIPDPLLEVSKKVLEKVTNEHIDYVVGWISLLQLEETAQTQENRIKDLWTLNPEKREMKGSCIANLTIRSCIRQDFKFLHTFIRNDSKGFSSEIIGQFSENEYVIISTDERSNISAGNVVELKENLVKVLLDRDLSKNLADNFHLDKYSYSNINVLNYANLAGLLNDHETCEKLRSIVIDKESASFEKGVDKKKVAKIARFMADLNEDQSKAVLKAIISKNYMLIKGMPGTGKTQTLIALILSLNQLGHSVLITAHTHSAVDNILLKLVEKGVDFLRLGSTGSMHSSLKLYSESYATSKCTTPESLDKVYNSKKIVGVTCYGSHHALLGKRIFDYCIVDESAQVMQPTILRPLFNAKVFILAGDPDQLPPVIRSATARKLGADETLFARLDSKTNTMLLSKQYRMNQSIMHLANKLTYRDKLSAANDDVKTSTFSADRNVLIKELWIQNVLSHKMEEAVIVLDTGHTFAFDNAKLLEKYGQDARMYSNVWEAAIILKLCDTLIGMSVEPERIGVIAPYRAHVMLLKKLLHSEIEVNTVDQYQGRDKDIIFYSCSRSFKKEVVKHEAQDKKRDQEILEDHRRLTVAVTRSKHKLIVVADVESVSQYSPFRKLFKIVGNKHVVKLVDGTEGFSWKSVVGSL